MNPKFAKSMQKKGVYYSYTPTEILVAKGFKLVINLQKIPCHLQLHALSSCTLILC